MPISAFAAARATCELRDWQVSNLEVQKILYLAHMVSLGRSGGAAPLINANFEAWDYGPVVPALYHRMKAFGSKPVRDVFQEYPLPGAGEPEVQILNEVSRDLRERTPGQLVAMTHWEEGAWAKHYAPSRRGTVIPNVDILEEYQRRVQ